MIVPQQWYIWYPIIEEGDGRREVGDGDSCLYLVLGDLFTGNVVEFPEFTHDGSIMYMMLM